MRLEAAIWGALLTPSVLCTAAHGLGLSNNLQRRHADLHDLMKREPSRTVDGLVKRSGVFGAPNGIWPTVAVPAGFTLAAGVQLTPVPEIILAGASGSAALSSALAEATAAPVTDPATWNKEAQDGCMAAAMKLQSKATNPAGLAVCYNVQFLDQQKGTFEAEIRMYTIAAPVDPFVGVTPSMMMVTLQYQGATIQNSDGTLPVKRSLEERQAPASATTAATMQSGVVTPKEVAIRKYIGQVNKSLMTPGMNLTQWQPLLVPQISISAMNPSTNQQVTTSLSTTESSFVAGVFSRAVGSTADPAFLLGKPADQLAAVAAGKPTPFVVPGLSLSVFPVGLIVTSTWLLFFSLTVGLGTLGRVQFREQYRREFREQQSSGVRRF